MQWYDFIFTRRIKAWLFLSLSTLLGCFQTTQGQTPVLFFDTFADTTTSQLFGAHTWVDRSGDSTLTSIGWYQWGWCQGDP